MVDYGLFQPLVDGVLKEQFTLDDADKQTIAEWLTPVYHTNKVGDGIDGSQRRQKRRLVFKPFNQQVVYPTCLILKKSKVPRHQPMT